MNKTAAFIIALCSMGSCALADDAAQDATDVSAQVRSQGYSCKEPVSATRDEAASKPDLPVYVLTCADATYSVKIVPDQAAVVTKEK